MRFVVIGGGILGLASARQALIEDPAAEVTLCESEPALATHQTGRNSGVVHAGIYYRPGSLKARLCRRGVGLLQDFCSEHGVKYQECGKVVVALDESQREGLSRLGETAHANGVPELRMLDANQLREIEPAAAGVAALHSPHTAIVDFKQVCAALAADIRQRGGQIRTGARALRVDPGSRPTVELADGSSLAADHVIVCAGLAADRLARASGQGAEPRIVPFRGEYWKLRPEREHLVRGLIYPVPDPSMPFLGVHLTKKGDGSVLIGPNAVLSLARSKYRRTSVNARDVVDTLAWPGTARMMRRHWRAGIDEMSRSLSRRVFISEAQRYVPALGRGDVVRAPSGIRAQAIDRDGTLVDDFRLEVGRGVAWVRNAPSPAATSSLAIAEELFARLNGSTI